MLPDAVAVGVPESSPPELNVSPVGSVPDVIDQVIGEVPVATNWTLYAVPTVPADKDVGKVIVGAVGDPASQLPLPIRIVPTYTP
jgi:hypothetical protein